MNIGVIGGGAIGMLYAVKLSEAFSVVLFTRTKKQAETITKDGLTEITGVQERKVSLHARSVEEVALWELDLVFVAVKQYQLTEVLSQLRQLRASIPLVFLQNGMGHLPLLKELPFSDIFVSTVEHGVQRVEETAFRVSGINKTNIACLKGDSQILESFLPKTSSRFPFIYREGAQDMLLEKMAANVVINPLTAVLKVPNGELVQNPFYFQLAQQAFREFESVFYEEKQMKRFDSVIEICKRTAANRSSMLKDVEEGRPTEVEAILGYVRQTAADKNIDVPFLTSLYLMMKGMQSTVEG